jgi:TatD DNase family protein
MWIDSHAHLFEYEKNSLEKILLEASAASVGMVLSTATSIETGIVVADQCSSFDQIYGVIGISPFDVTNQPSNWLSSLKSLLIQPRVIALGEIGLDCSNPAYPPLKQQVPFFETQLELAQTLNIPAVVHSRGYEKEVVEICLNMGAKRVLFHCFTGTYDAMKAIVDAGFYISFSGIITFKNADVRSVVSSVPIDRIFIETDSPYLSPVPYRGKKNRPALLKYTAIELAGLLNKREEELQFQLEKNFYSLFFNGSL